MVKFICKLWPIGIFRFTTWIVKLIRSRCSIWCLIQWIVVILSMDLEVCIRFRIWPVIIIFWFIQGSTSMILKCLLLPKRILKAPSVLKWGQLIALSLPKMIQFDYLVVRILFPINSINYEKILLFKSLCKKVKQGSLIK